jgi:hypothetical protein
MFCTAEEAARKLDATETELEILIEDDVLPEFRDGASRFLRIADVDALLARRGGVALQVRAEPQSLFESPGLPGDDRSTTTDEEIRLPACATVKVKTADPQCRPAGAESQRRANPAHLPPRQPSAPRRNVRPEARRAPSAQALPAYRTKPQTQEMSLRQWLWTGVRDDRPHTLIALALTILAGVCGLIGAAYLLGQVL